MLALLNHEKLIQLNGNGLSLLSSNILSSENCIIEKNTMEHFSGGFEGWSGTFGLVGASNNTIRNNTLVDVDRGIEFMESSNNSIYNNKMLDTTYGIYSEDNGGPYIFADNVIQNNIITARDIGIYLSGHFQRNTFTLNSINGTNHDVYLKDWSKDNQFIHNNFLSTNQSSHCYFKLRLNSVKEVWDANYWGKPRVFPVVIFGKTGLFGSMIFPWIQIESHPAQQPYNIPIMNEGGFQ